MTEVKVDVFEGLETVQCCYAGSGEHCVCPHSERILRAFADHALSLPNMTQQQREWCLNEIGSVEGYERGDYANCSDSDLAITVLHAWTDYCRDKGLL